MSQMNAREARRFAWACTLATLVATAAVYADGPVYVNLGPLLKWCETASNWAYIAAGCWMY